MDSITFLSSFREKTKIECFTECKGIGGRFYGLRGWAGDGNKTPENVCVV